VECGLWERNALVKEGLMKLNSDRGMWEIGERAKKLEASLHWKRGGDDKMTDSGPLEKIAAAYQLKARKEKYFIMVGDEVYPGGS
jgi:hypothetical protein